MSIEAGYPIFPFTRDPNKTSTILGWVVTTDYDPKTKQPPSVGVAATDPATWPEEYDGIDDLLLMALRHAEGRRVVIDILFVDE